MLATIMPLLAKFVLYKLCVQTFIQNTGWPSSYVGYYYAIMLFLPLVHSIQTFIHCHCHCTVTVWFIQVVCTNFYTGWPPSYAGHYHAIMLTTCT